MGEVPSHRPPPGVIRPAQPFHTMAAMVTAATVSSNVPEDRSTNAPSTTDLVNEHLWLVDRLARQTARKLPSYVDRSELWSAGALGLVDAARRYDPTQKVPFAAYATARVRGEMLETARQADLAPRRLRRSLRELSEATE